MQHSDEKQGDHSAPAFTGLADLASARIGGSAIAANDDFFASKSNLVKASSPIFVPGKFTSRGKWMDGWESRRRRTPGHDWCVVRLGVRGRIFGVDVDTRFFTGNHPSHCSIDALDTARPVAARLAGIDGSPWVRLLDKVPLRGNDHNYFALPPVTAPSGQGDGPGPGRAFTHIRLNIFPDGGVARFRVYGEAEVDWARLAARRRTIDLAAIQHGGLVLGASDMHFGARDNMIMPGRAVNMGDGWETRRRRGPGYDWAIVRLGTSGIVQRVEIDTNHFKGNYPEAASLDACNAPGATLDGLAAVQWTELLPRTTLRAHHRHFFSTALGRPGPVSHVRLNIFPDGGISRLRVHGTVAPAR